MNWTFIPTNRISSSNNILRIKADGRKKLSLELSNEYNNKIIWKELFRRIFISLFYEGFVPAIIKNKPKLSWNFEYCSNGKKRKLFNTNSVFDHVVVFLSTMLMPSNNAIEILWTLMIFTNSSQFRSFNRKLSGELIWIILALELIRNSIWAQSLEFDQQSCIMRN